MWQTLEHLSQTPNTYGWSRHPARMTYSNVEGEKRGPCRRRLESNSVVRGATQGWRAQSLDGKNMPSLVDKLMFCTPVCDDDCNYPSKPQMWAPRGGRKRRRAIIRISTRHPAGCHRWERSWISCTQNVRWALQISADQLPTKASNMGQVGSVEGYPVRTYPMCWLVNDDKGQD